MSSTGDFQITLETARKEIYQTPSITVQNINLGRAALGKNIYSASVTNKNNRNQKLLVKVIAHPGLWFRPWKDEKVFDLAAGIETQISSSYQFTHMTPEAWLKISLGVIEGSDVKWFAEKKYLLGENNPAINYDLTHFKIYKSEHFEFHYFKGSLAEKEIDLIVQQRERAAHEISKILGVTYPEKIRIFYYSDYKTKKDETGHMGEGWAFSNIIVEIYNEDIKLDPFHELAHIYGELIGSPPALFDEGFAVYISEKLGADALQYMGASGQTVSDVTRQYHEKNELFSLDQLIGFAEIGSPESKPAISYPQSASFVHYLIENHGFEKFQYNFKELAKPLNEATHAANIQHLKKIYGLSVNELEMNWLKIFTPSRRS